MRYSRFLLCLNVVCYVWWLHVVNSFTNCHGKGLSSLLFDLVVFCIKLMVFTTLPRHPTHIAQNQVQLTLPGCVEQQESDSIALQRMHFDSDWAKECARYKHEKVNSEMLCECICIRLAINCVSKIS